MLRSIRTIALLLDVTFWKVNGDIVVALIISLVSILRDELLVSLHAIRPYRHVRWDSLPNQSAG
jgi:hypothetical protein